MIRAFLALPLPDDIRSALAVQQFLLPVPDRLPPESFHITLVFLGEQPEPVLEEVHLALTALRIADFPVTLHGIGHFGRDRPRSVHATVIPSPPLMALQQKVEQVARRAGIAVPAQKYVPHVTLARFRTPGADLLPSLTRAIATARFAAGPWQAERMVLFRSRPGPRYEDLADYPFTR
jgi:2'-5' RNA ligase